MNHAIKFRATPALPVAESNQTFPVGRIYCVGRNYAEHAREMGHDPQREPPFFFMKPADAIVQNGATLPFPRATKDLHYEIEMVVAIGRDGADIPAARALDHVFGYTICWDFSQRDPWGRGRQNTRNIRKGFDTFTGLGPWIVTRDEIDDPQDLEIRVEQNGREVMHAHTGDMICGLREHIRFLSDVLTLQPGALITTGTPAGVAQLADGDHLRGSIEKIGTMEVDVRAE